MGACVAQAAGRAGRPRAQSRRRPAEARTRSRRQPASIRARSRHQPAGPETGAADQQPAETPGDKPATETDAERARLLDWQQNLEDLLAALELDALGAQPGSPEADRAGFVRAVLELVKSALKALTPGPQPGQADPAGPAQGSTGQAEQTWRALLGTAKPGLTLERARWDADLFVDAAINDARRNFLGTTPRRRGANPDLQALQDHLRLHAAQARENYWNMLLRDLGIGTPHPGLAVPAGESGTAADEQTIQSHGYPTPPDSRPATPVHQPAPQNTLPTPPDSRPATPSTEPSAPGSQPGPADATQEDTAQDELQRLQDERQRLQEIMAGLEQDGGAPPLGTVNGDLYRVTEAKLRQVEDALAPYAERDVQQLPTLRRQRERLETRLARLTEDPRPVEPGTFRADEIRAIQLALAEVQRKITKLASGLPSGEATPDPPPSPAEPEPAPGSTQQQLVADIHGTPEQRELAWQKYQTELREKYPSDRPATRTWTLIQSHDWLNRQVEPAVERAWRTYSGPPGLLAHGRYIAYHSARARDAAWRQLHSDHLGIDLDKLTQDNGVPRAEGGPRLAALREAAWQELAAAAQRAHPEQWRGDLRLAEARRAHPGEWPEDLREVPFEWVLWDVDLHVTARVNEATSNFRDKIPGWDDANPDALAFQNYVRKTAELAREEAWRPWRDRGVDPGEIERLAQQRAAPRPAPKDDAAVKDGKASQDGKAPAEGTVPSEGTASLESTAPPEGSASPETTVPPEPAALTDEAYAAESEKWWRAHLSTMRQAYPTGQPTRPDVTLQEALEEIEPHVQAAADRAWEEAEALPDLPETHVDAIVSLAEEQARREKWTELYRSAGIDLAKAEEAARNGTAVPDVPLPPLGVPVPPPASAGLPDGTASATATAPAASAPSANGTRPGAATSAAVAPPGWAVLPPPGATFLRAPRDTVLHAQAAAAVPTAEGWHTLLGHGSGAFFIDGGAQLGAREIARRLGLYVPATGPDGKPVPPPENPVKVMMLGCAAVQAAAELHAVTGNVHEVLVAANKGHQEGGEAGSGAVTEAIMLPDYDKIDGGTVAQVIAGTWKPGESLQPEPDPAGDFVLFRDGAPHSMGTPYLLTALRGLGAKLRASKARPPSRAVGFYYGPTPEQTAALNAIWYEVPPAELARAESIESFYTSLIAVAGPLLPTPPGEAPTPAWVRQELELELRTAPRHRYQNFVAEGQDPTTVPTDQREAAYLLPHVAANRFGLDLRVLGALGEELSAGDPGGPRRTGTRNEPFRLVRLPDGTFAPALFMPSPGLPRRPAPVPRAPGAPTAWTEQLSVATRRLIEQEGASAPLPPGSAPRSVLRRVAEMNVLAQSPEADLGLDLAEPRPADLSRIQLIVTAALSPEEPQAAAALAQLERLERLQPVLAVDTSARAEELYQEYLTAAGEVSPQQGAAERDAADMAAERAALVRALAERAGTVRAARDAPAPAEPPAGGIREAVEGLRGGITGPGDVPPAIVSLSDRITSLATASIQHELVMSFERQLAEAQLIVTNATVPPALLGSIAEMHVLAQSPGAGEAMPRESDKSHVENVIAAALSSESTSQQTTDAVAELERLERMAAVLSSDANTDRAGQLAREYMAAMAEAAPEQGAVQRDAAEEAATIAADARTIAELAPALRAARDAAAPASPPAGGIREAVEGLRGRITRPEDVPPATASLSDRVPNLAAARTLHELSFFEPRLQEAQRKAAEAVTAAEERLRPYREAAADSGGVAGQVPDRAGGVQP